MAEYIEREALLKDIDDLKKSPWYNDDYGNGTRQARHDGINCVVDLCIKQAPAADVVEVVHGEWVETYQPLGFDEVKCAECSSCGEDWIMDDDMCIDDYKAHWKYCPCCGAKMDGKRKDSDEECLNT